MPTLIDTSTLSYFGTMTAGSGLAAIFDGTIDTFGYIGQPSGWAGVTLASAQKIASVELVSNPNGFDGSGAQGSTSTITLKVYGTTGTTPPSSLSSATLLATIGPFEDVNQYTTKTATITDQTNFNHVMVEVICDYPGSWAVLRSARLYAPDAVPTARVIGAVPTFVTTFVTENLDVFGGPSTYTPLTPAFDLIQITVPTFVQLDATVGFEHKGNYFTTGSLPAGIGWGLRAVFRPGSSEAAASPTVGVGVNMPTTWPKGVKAAGNLFLEDHYVHAALVGGELLAPGYYRFEPWAHCHGASNGNPADIPATFSPLRVIGSATNDPQNIFRLSFFPQSS